MKRVPIAAVGLALVVGVILGGMRIAWVTEPAEAQGPPNANAVSGCERVPRQPQDVFFFFGSDVPWDAAWIDLSLKNNGFAPGTFLSAGPFPALDAGAGTPGWRYTNTYAWRNLTPGVTHYFRVNLLYGGQWYPSATQSFFVSATCGGATVQPVTTADVSALERRLDDLQGTVASLESQVESLQSQVDSLKMCLRRSDIYCN